MVRNIVRSFFTHSSRVTRGSDVASVLRRRHSSSSLCRPCQRQYTFVYSQTAIGATTMKLLNRLSDKIAGRPSSSQTTDDTAQLLRSSSNTPITPSSPAPLHASLPYGFEWSPRPLSHGQTYMLSTTTLALGREYKQASSLALLEK